MVSINLGSISTIESFGGLLNCLKIKQLRVSPPEFSFNNSFSSDFAIGTGFRIDRIIMSILNGSILSLEAFGNLKVPDLLVLYGIPSKERLGAQTLDYLYLYSLGTILYVVDEAKNKRLEKVAIKNVMIQKVQSVNSSSQVVGSPYKVWEGSYYSILYEDTLGRYWEEQELTTDPQSFFGWYEANMKKSPKERSIVSVDSLGRRKKNVDWSKSKLFSRKMAEKGVLHRIKVKKASIRKGNVLVYLDEKNNSWEENELVFETMAAMLVKKFKEKEKKEGE
jgi:hypothetical protein